MFAASEVRAPRWVRLLDHVIALAVAEPLVSLFWCGGFFLTDVYVYPDDRPFSYWFIFIVGSMLSLCIHVQCATFVKLSGRCPDSSHLLQRVTGIVLIIAIIFQWNGLWCIVDHYSGNTVKSCLVSWALGTAILCVTKCRCNMVVGVPFQLRHDRPEILFAATTRFHMKTFRSRWWEFCDHLFSLFVVQPAVILVWRGLWNLQDCTLLPSDPVQSANISCVSGATVVIGLYLLQDLVGDATVVLRPRTRFVVELFWQELTVASSVTLWRGQWLWFAIAFQGNLSTVWAATVAAGWMLTTLNMGGLATQVGALPDPPLDHGTEPTIRFPIDYIAQIYRTHVSYSKTDKQRQQQHAQEPSTPSLSRPLLEMHQATVRALYPLLNDIHIPSPDSTNNNDSN